MQTPEWDRRETVRVSIRRPCKLYEPRGDRYAAGTTCDLSPQGAGITLDDPLPIEPGDVIRLGVAATRRQPLLQHDEMVEATVRHVLLTADDRTILGVQFAVAEVDEVELLRAA